MIASAVAIVATLSIGLTHFGPADNVRIESIGRGVRVTAYGDASFVPLLLTRAELQDCVHRLETNEDAGCLFAHRGSIIATHAVGASTLTFADPLHANIVDVALDDAGFSKAIAAMRAAT